MIEKERKRESTVEEEELYSDREDTRYLCDILWNTWYVI